MCGHRLGQGSAAVGSLLVVSYGIILCKSSDGGHDMKALERGRLSEGGDYDVKLELVVPPSV